MGSMYEPECQFVDTGTAPEFFVDAIPRRELIAGGNVRTYFCIRRGGLLIAQCTTIVPLGCMRIMARDAVRMADNLAGEICLREGATH